MSGSACATDIGFDVQDAVGLTGPKLARFFFFNPTLSKSETDTEKKVLFYYPKSVASFDQAQSVGLVQGISSFTKQFAPDEECQFLTTKKHKLSFFNPEPEFFLVVMVENPRVDVERDKPSWRDRELEPQLLKKVLRRTYEMWYLLHGSLQGIMDTRGVDGLKAALDVFMRVYFPVLDFSRLDVFAVIDGIAFLPMDRNLWLDTQSFANSVEHACPEVLKSCVFFKDHLICSSTDAALVRLVAHFLFQFPATRQQLRNDTTSGSVINLCVVPELADRGAAAPGGGLPGSIVVHSRLLKGRESVRMVALKVYELVVVLFVDDVAARPDEEYLRVVGRAGLPLVESLRVAFQASLEGEGGEFRFIYFNSLNWALKTSLGGSRRLMRETLHVISSVHVALEEGGTQEVAVRTHDGSWIVGKKVDRRELIVVYEQSNDTLLDIEVKVKRLADSFLGHILWL